MPDNRISLGLS